MPELLRDQCKLYHFFCGQWQLERTIYIKNSGSIHAKAYGIVCFTPGLSEDQLHYEERGKLMIAEGGSEISFSRNFRYKFNDHNMEVYFADGPIQDYFTNVTFRILIISLSLIRSTYAAGIFIKGNIIFTMPALFH